MLSSAAGRLVDVMPELERALTFGSDTAAQYSVAEIRCSTVWVTMRDGVRLATDIYRPPIPTAPTIVMRTPYGRAGDRFAGAFLAFARRGYVVVSQDCRGTGESEPDTWDYYGYESEDGYDAIEWITKQPWFDGFVGACGGSYVAQTQWCMALHPCMSTIVPEVSGLGVAINTAHIYLFVNSYARCIGKGSGKVSVHYTEMERVMHRETMEGGFFNEPLHPPFPQSILARYPQLLQMHPHRAKRWLWEQYCQLPCAERVALARQALGIKHLTMLDVESLTPLFGPQVSHDAHTIPHASPDELCRLIHAMPLMVTGWYDWALNDALSTWALIQREGRGEVRERARLIITPSAHNMPGYHEGMDRQPELQRLHYMPGNASLLLHWLSVVRSETFDAWPTVIYYLMGANEWRVASAWPPVEAGRMALYLASNGALTSQPTESAQPADRYTYDPCDPTPTLGGSIVSWLYPPGSVDVSAVQQRSDVLCYTTAPLESDLDVVGPLRLILYVSSSAADTDFTGRISDVFPDGRAVQIQSGILRTRYRNLPEEPEFMVPGEIYRLEIDLWATANRFKAGHRLRLDISSADFPRYDRNSNRGEELGAPIPAIQTIYRDEQRSSHVLLSVLSAHPLDG